MTLNPKRLNPWFYIPYPVPEAKRRLLIFHHAGGNSARYFTWSSQFSAVIEVVLLDLPGRGVRFLDTPIEDMNKVIGELQLALSDCIDKPFSFFGHSLGGIIAFLLTAAQQRLNRPLPEHIFLSSVHPDCVCNRIQNEDQLSLFEYVKELGGISDAVLNNPDFLKIVMNVLKADFKLLQSAQMSKERIDCPIFAFIGNSDPHISVEKIKNWQHLTTKFFKHFVFEGGHFYLDQHETKLISELNNILTH